MKKKSHLGVAPAISIRYRSLKKKKKFFDFFNFFSSKKIAKKSLIPTVYNNLGQIFLEMGQKRQNKLFLGQTDNLAQKELILMFLAHFQKYLI